MLDLLALCARPWRGPLEPAAREPAIERWDEQRAGGEGPEEPVRAEEDELDERRPERHEAREHDATGARVRRRLGVADHVEREQRQPAALELVERGAPGLTQVRGAAE